MTGTALITGASTGLGAEFARLFARDGYGVILAARSAGRLEALAEELRLAHQATAHVVVADLSQPAAAQALFDEVTRRGLTVDFLVNNAGYGTNGAFLDLDLAKEAEMVELNCNTLLKLCHLFGRPMRERKQGRILNIASTAAFQPGPFMATYYASKAFVMSFSEALAHELRGTGVTVTCSCPGATLTEFGARSGNGESRLFQSAWVARAADVAAEAYEAMLQGEVIKVHGMVNWVLTQGVRISPRAVARSLAAGLNKRDEG